MPSFVRDIHLRVHSQHGETSVEAPPDTLAGDFLDSLRISLGLSSKDAGGQAVRWHLYDREGKKLDPRRTLSENGISDGHEIHIREEEKHHGSDEPRRDPPSDKGRKVLVRCDNYHYYDPKKYSTCPHCEAARANRK